MADDIKEILKLSSALSYEGRLSDQESLLRDSLNEFPDDPELHLHLATNVFDRSPTEATNLLNRCKELAPSDSRLLILCGQLFLSIGEVESAIECARHAHDHLDDELTGWPSLSYLTGRIALEKKLYEDAERYLREAFEEQPDLPQHGRELAHLYRQTGRLKEALDIIDQALKHNAFDDGLLRLRSEILSALGIIDKTED